MEIPQSQIHKNKKYIYLFAIIRIIMKNKI